MDDNLLLYVDSQSKRIECEYCHGEGTWDVECCNGAGGCSCRGGKVDMGVCQICQGRGFYFSDENIDLKANYNSISGFGFIGTGPVGGYFGVPAMGKY